jgi:hypothetical protein
MTNGFTIIEPTINQLHFSYFRLLSQQGDFFFFFRHIHVSRKSKRPVVKQTPTNERPLQTSRRSHPSHSRQRQPLSTPSYHDNRLRGYIPSPPPHPIPFTEDSNCISTSFFTHPHVPPPINPPLHRKPKQKKNIKRNGSQQPPRSLVTHPECHLASVAAGRWQRCAEGCSWWGRCASAARRGLYHF